MSALIDIVYVACHHEQQNYSNIVKLLNCNYKVSIKTNFSFISCANMQSVWCLGLKVKKESYNKRKKHLPLRSRGVKQGETENMDKLRVARSDKQALDANLHLVMGYFPKRSPPQAGHTPCLNRPTRILNTTQHQLPSVCNLKLWCSFLCVMAWVHRWGQLISWQCH